MMGGTTTAPAENTAPYLARFDDVAATLPGGDLPWLADARRAAIARFAETGFPTRRDEAWKYTDLRRALRDGPVAPPRPGRAPAKSALRPWRLDGPCHLMVFVDGRFAPALSDIAGLPDGVRLVSLAAAADEAPALIEDRFGAAGDDGGLSALNAAFAEAGAVLDVADGVEIEDPIQLLFLSRKGAAGAVTHPRTLIALGTAARATVAESFAGAKASYWTNAVSGIAVGPGAALRHFRLQDEGDAATHTGLIDVRLASDAVYRAFVMSAGARLARNEFHVRLEGRGAECEIDGATLLRGRQHTDNTTHVVHAALDGRSRQHFKSVLDDAARSVFQGRVTVEAGAQRTDAHQLNRNLLLSPRAEADSKPELIIHADDVKCSHGATTGDLDRDAMFYLRARGISPEQARALLVEGFIGEMFEDVAPAALRAHLAAHLAAWLGQPAEEREAA